MESQVQTWIIFDFREIVNRPDFVGIGAFFRPTSFFEHFLQIFIEIRQFFKMRIDEMKRNDSVPFHGNFATSDDIRKTQFLEDRNQNFGRKKVNRRHFRVEFAKFSKINLIRLETSKIFKAVLISRSKYYCWKVNKNSRKLYKNAEIVNKVSKFAAENVVHW